MGFEHSPRTQEMLERLTAFQEREIDPREEAHQAARRDDRPLAAQLSSGSILIAPHGHSVPQMSVETTESCPVVSVRLTCGFPACGSSRALLRLILCRARCLRPRPWAKPQA